MTKHDLLSHLTDIQSLTFEEGMDVYKNMREVRGRVSTLLAYFRSQPAEETQAFLYDEENHPVPFPSRRLFPGGPVFDTLPEALTAIPALTTQAPKLVLKCYSGVYEINKVE